MDLAADRPYKHWTERLFWPLAIVVFIIICIRSYLVPVHHDEASTFFFYIQTGEYLPFFSHIDANNHVLNSTLSFICFKLFGDSLFSIRLPNTLSFLVLAYGAWRLLRQAKSPVSKSLLIGGFILSFHFLSFFSTCRGYGLSMALLTFALACFSAYLVSFSLPELIGCLFAFQLAISCNLTLTIVMLPVLFVLSAAQIINRQLNWKTVAVHLLNVLLLFYWIRFSFFLQDHNALYYGEGESYYKTTYLSLCRLLSGSRALWVAYAGSALLIGAFIIAAVHFFKKERTIKSGLSSGSTVFAFLTGSLIIGFYLLKKLMGINYPEDRTGLFLYVFFIIFMAFAADEFTGKYSNAASALILAAFVIHFAVALNFRKHSLVNYESVPQRFYDYLAAEQSRQQSRITVTGHRMRELFYAYDNYRHSGELNLMHSPDYMQMNGDYAIALKNERPYYSPYYAEVDSEPDWNYMLLKRKEPIKRVLRMNLALNQHFEGTDEFYNILMKKQDTIVESHNPILAEFDIQVKNHDVPNRAWIVMQIDTLPDGHYYYSHIPLNWLHYKWNESRTYTYSLMSGPLDHQINMGFYIYNPQRQHIEISVKSLRLYELQGKGVQAVSRVLN